MPQKVKETRHTVEENGLQPISRIMQVIFALIQFLLVFRFAFKLLGANASNVFVNLIYATTAPLVGLFEGIFPEVILENSAQFAVFEPATVIAIIVTAAVAYIVLRLLSVKQDRRTEYVEVQEQPNAVPLGQVSEQRVTHPSEAPLTHGSERPLPYNSEAPLTHGSEAPLTHERPVPHASDTTLEQREKARLEKESQELEERIRHQQQILEDQKKMYSTAHDEAELQELEEKIRQQERILEEHRKMDAAAYDETELDDDPNNINRDIPVYKKPRRQI